MSTLADKKINQLKDLLDESKKQIEYLEGKLEIVVEERDTLAEDFNSAENELLSVKKERDELKTRIEDGLRVKYWIDKECINNRRIVIFNHAEPNATLILDDGVEL
jgi:uncharacterized coiled-coil DUF342 family protein